MENASKALIMAGSILIGVIIMSIGVYVFSVYGGTSEQIQKQLNEKAIAEFNAHFTKYEGMQECTIHDIVSLVNFAKKYNEDLEVQENPGDSYHIKVKVDVLGTRDSDSLTVKSTDDLIDMLSGPESETYYKCGYGDIEYDEIGKVKQILFKKGTSKV